MRPLTVNQIDLLMQCMPGHSVELFEREVASARGLEKRGLATVEETECAPLF